MPIQARNGKERLRTIWTPEMDCYFINLMVEQVEKGNRIDDCLFSKRAWKHMMTLFNMKFKFPYEKDVLKNRHKTLRNLYKGVKNLLNQRGFSWDKMRQMVTADNNVWDEYIKEHPDARSYRIKTIPYYEDLCIIYGGTPIEHKVNDGAKLHSNILKSESDGLVVGLDFGVHGYNEEPGNKITKSFPDSEGDTGVKVSQERNYGDGDIESLHEILIDEDYHSPVSKEGTNSIPQANPDATSTTVNNRTRTYWQPPMDRYFIDLMLEQARKGNQVDGVFRKQSWMEMIALFNTKFGFKYDMDVLKNRYKTLRRQYNVISNLLELNGFAWDDTRQMIIADDYVWQDYIKGHSDARQFMTRPVPYYKDLCVICSDLIVDDKCCLSSQSQVIAVSEKEDQPGDEKGILMGSHKNKRQLEALSDFDNVKKVCTENECMAWPLSDARPENSKDETDASSYLIERVIEAVQALPDMDHDLILDACDLMEDEIKAKTFLALDVKIRKKWLMRKLRPQQKGVLG